MIFVLSPAKRLDFESPLPTAVYTQPRLLDDAKFLVERLRTLSPAEIASLMSLSDPLARLNHARYADWQLPFHPANARQAVFAFAGDVYEGLQAGRLPESALQWLQGHVRILSGLYGVLRPFDLMQPYRLEMGTRLSQIRGKDLYTFWGERITDCLMGDVQASAAELKSRQAEVLVNLASEEYFKSVHVARLGVPVIQPVFEEWKAGRYGVVSFFAKRARGLMVHYAACKQLTDVAVLQEFDLEGYGFCPEASDDLRWVFRRRRL